MLRHFLIRAKKAGKNRLKIPQWWHLSSSTELSNCCSKKLMMIKGRVQWRQTSKFLTSASSLWCTIIKKSKMVHRPAKNTLASTLQPRLPLIEKGWVAYQPCSQALRKWNLWVVKFQLTNWQQWPSLNAQNLQLKNRHSLWLLDSTRPKNKLSNKQSQVCSPFSNQKSSLH